MTDERRQKLWEALQHKRPHMEHFLTEVGLMGAYYPHISTFPGLKVAPSIRGGVHGIRDLEVEFKYPVSVIAGENGCGKSTVLFAAACAYKVPGVGAKQFVPSDLFSDYKSEQGMRGDEEAETTLRYKYLTPDGESAAMWRQDNKGHDGRLQNHKNENLPERQVYLITPGNLINRSEPHGEQEMPHTRRALLKSALTPPQIEFAQRLLPFEYLAFINLPGSSEDEANLLFAIQKSGAEYSEQHMATGERAILRLSKEIAQARNALVLIDEVEAGLHPSAQQSLMLELQQLALSNNLQIIVTTHSPVVLDSVPDTGRIFLERDEEGRVSAHPAYRDLIQDALYGRLDKKLNLLCEDKMGESLLQGVFDIITPRLNARRESIRIGRDTGAEEFPGHAKAFVRFGQLQNFIFVLDGDKRKTDLEKKIKKNTNQEARVAFLPGEDAPEVWVWKELKDFFRSMGQKVGYCIGRSFPADTPLRFGL